jgi:hypothetical protein
MLQINHILLLLILLASHMDSQISPLWFYSVYLHLHRIMNPPFHPLSVCPSANLSSFHLPHTETHQWGPHPSSVFHEIFSLPGALISHWGTRFCICTFSPNLFHYLLYKHLYFHSFPFVITVGDLLHFFTTRNPCHPWLEHCFSFTLVGIIHIFRVLHRSLASTL